MGWILFLISAWLSALVFVPIKYWSRFWPCGILGLAIIYPIDGTLVSLGAFKFHHIGISVSGLPLAYWLSYFPGGVLFARFRPSTGKRKMIYIILSALFLLTLELIMKHYGYFQHLRWNSFRSFILNIGGFTIIISLFEWLNYKNTGSYTKDKLT